MQRGRTTLGLVLAAVLAAGAGYYFHFVHSYHAPQRGAVSAYVDPAACDACHQDIAESYRRTGMGRSFFQPRPENTLEDYTGNNSFYHKASDRHYRMLQHDGKYYRRRHQTGFDGRETNIVEKEIHFVMGSGNHARTYLHRTPQGKIAELPLGWYAERGGYWAMNPGYDRPDHQDFRLRKSACFQRSSGALRCATMAYQP